MRLVLCGDYNAGFAATQISIKHIIPIGSYNLESHGDLVRFN